LLRRSNRFSHLDPAVFLDPEVTDDEYVAPYGSQFGSDTTA